MQYCLYIGREDHWALRFSRQIAVASHVKVTNMSESASSQHILISYAEYERLKHIEEEFEKLQKSLHEKLQIPQSSKIQ